MTFSSRLASASTRPHVREILDRPVPAGDDDGIVAAHVDIGENQRLFNPGRVLSQVAAHALGSFHVRHAARSRH
jgi:hypothetical protein